MDAKDYQDKIDKCYETINKKIDLIGKRYSQAEKKIKALNALGLYQFAYIEDYKQIDQQGKDAVAFYQEHWMGKSDEEFYNKGQEWHDLYYGACDLREITESIENAYRAIEDKKKTVEGYQQKLAEAQKKEDVLANMPECMKELMERTIASWDAWDQMKRASVKEATKRYYELGDEARRLRRENGMDSEEAKAVEYERRELCERFSQFEWHELCYMSDEAIHERNVKASKDLVTDLYYRVIKIVDDFADASRLKVTSGNEGFAVINGFVKGSNGRIAKVQSVGAGGWNIQRWHIRTLVHEYKGVL